MRTNYYVQAESDAWDTVEEFTEEILEQIRLGDAISDDLHNDYGNGDEYHHLTHVDKAYTLIEAAELLDQLSDWEEDDSGLWEGLEPRRAIAAQAAFTYGNCVLDKWRELVAELNDESTDIDFGDDDDVCNNARAKWVATYIACKRGEGYTGTVAELFAGAKEGCGRGEFTGLLVLADAVAESGDERTAQKIREIVTEQLTT